jgi:hypothetical protein
VSAPSDQPALRIVRGNPTPEELAVVTAVVAAASAGGAASAGATASAGGAARVPAEARRGRWNDPGAAHRRAIRPAAGAWRASAR